MSHEISGTIFDIKRFAVHDGPGIRTTVFFKGCPLSCRWCHNPEGINSEIELFVYPERCSPECDECMKMCPDHALEKMNGSIIIRREKCNICEICQDVCMFDAIRIVGRKVSLQNLMEEISDDKIFFERSGGGVTLSGGEPLMQLDFLEALVDELRRNKIHIALDTSGYSSSENIVRIAEKVDLVLFDFKILSEEDHLKYNGVSNSKIIANLRTLAGLGINLVVRLPLMKDINDTDENIEGTVALLSTMKGIDMINLLPYHQGGNQKLERLGLERNDCFYPPTSKRLAEICSIFEKRGFKVGVGG
jgi:pyruvate formate lyase activating enzyme